MAPRRDTVAVARCACACLATLTSNSRASDSTRASCGPSAFGATLQSTASRSLAREAIRDIPQRSRQAAGRGRGRLHRTQEPSELDRGPVDALGSTRQRGVVAEPGNRLGDVLSGRQQILEHLVVQRVGHLLTDAGLGVSHLPASLRRSSCARPRTLARATRSSSRRS